MTPEAVRESTAWQPRAALLPPLAALDEHAVEWCMLEDGERAGAPRAVCLLVGDGSAARRALGAAGLISLGRVGPAGAELFVGYDVPRDEWLRLEVTTRLDLGPLQDLGSLVAQGLLARRVRRASVAVLSGDEAFWALLLRAIVATGHLSPATTRRLSALATDARRDGPLGRLVDGLCPQGWSSARVIELARVGDAPALVPLGGELARVWRRRRSTSARLRHLGERARRAAASVGIRAGGLSVALVAPDGAGKSTLAAGLRDVLPVPVRLVYMGMRRDGEGRGGAWALSRLARQWRRYVVARYDVARGRVAIFDRYSYDALLPGPRAHDALRRVRRWLFSHAVPPPHVGVFLDAPGEVMFRRKGEHDVHALERRREDYLRLAARVPRLNVVDATRPPEQVRRDVSTLIWRTWTRRLSRTQGGS
jgi:thymidylate kinase